MRHKFQMWGNNLACTIDDSEAVPLTTSNCCAVTIKPLITAITTYPEVTCIISWKNQSTRIFFVSLWLTLVFFFNTFCCWSFLALTAAFAAAFSCSFCLWTLSSYFVAFSSFAFFLSISFCFNSFKTLPSVMHTVLQLVRALHDRFSDFFGSGSLSIPDKTSKDLVEPRILVELFWLLYVDSAELVFTSGWLILVQAI